MPNETNLLSRSHRYAQPTHHFSEWVKRNLYFSKADNMVHWTAQGRERRGVRIDESKPAGTVTARGYRIITIMGKQHPATRIAWYLQTGVWPLSPVTTIDGTRTNYHIDNMTCDTLPLTDAQIRRIDEVVRQKQRYTLTELAAMARREVENYHAHPPTAQLWPVFEWLKRVKGPEARTAEQAVAAFELLA